jgi:Ser/Thr protein kinase RdoA (MazF antagonist)
MQPFDRLTPRGRIGRLRDLARVALAEYGLEDARVTLLKQTFNTLFRVVDRNGRKTALRVGTADRVHTDETEAVETAWLVALRAETDIDAPLPIANRAGAFVTNVECDGVPARRRCVLFEWARGRRLSEVIDEPSAARAGALLARLHVHGAGFEGGRPQPVNVADTVALFAVPDRIPRIDARYGTLFAEAIDRAQRAVDALWADPPHPPHLVHGDLHPDNILVWRRRLTPIDFQDSFWGFEVQDLAITVAALERHADAARLGGALRAGYERVRPWPADDATIRELVGARHLSQLNLGCNVRRPGLDEFVARQADWLRAWMRAAE